MSNSARTAACLMNKLMNYDRFDHILSKFYLQNTESGWTDFCETVALAACLLEHEAKTRLQDNDPADQWDKFNWALSCEKLAATLARSIRDNLSLSGDKIAACLVLK